ncbi:UbiH/UbiF/VisC/COQ6 family ubiquinone biosynthesis hydroxylase [Oceanicoccus sagamiensis]|uniref:2-octaprenyl-3-methyl-6-methoxy-1,4-benzoquinol hydroxylase n=1 Tax=Oceanicoccus sagamiensis TaxID=716816 RepID=A0A1X9N935_9GAMM|nr:UbiH/UbiF/VisC/COQ6 family ubiquinone biosynthesis hydroxylase [Oceanicoccus sagamiensis]ARN73691.1 2-octaprenyl-3-methyl-6-methoxy-1,4-benzoquinol hydroxylase [Oceanicoccus sagamiensis]
MSKSAADFDVIIVGAGMVGAALACALGGSELKVAVIEARPINTDWPEQADAIDGFDPRVSALTVASQAFLQRLDIWSAIRERRISPYRQMHVWDAEGTGNIHFAADDINQPVLGHIVENRVTATALLQKIQQHRNIECIAPVTLEAIQSTESGAYQIALDDGRSLSTDLLVAADGANSNVRSLAAMAMREWDYGHHAIVTTVKTEKPHQQTAWQRFLPEGPLAFLPLSTAEQQQHYSSIVWSAIPQYAENLMALDDAEFSLDLARAFEHRLGEVTDVSRRFSFPLRQRHAVDYIKTGIALVGDAAHTIHPLAGQGVNLGLMDALALSEELLRAEQRALNPGSLPVLQRYQRRRKAANLSMMAGMEGFKRLFEQPSLPVRWARNAGLRWLNKATPLKNQVMRQAMGL